MKPNAFTSISFAALLAYILIAFQACSGTINTPLSEEEFLPDTTSLTTYTYLALGDSYTIGQGVEETNRWPVQLTARLNAEGISVKSPDIIAQTGWTTTNLLTAIDARNPGEHDMISLLIGVNNQFQNRPFTIFKTEFDSLLMIAAGLASQGVFVVSIPDYGVTPFGSANSDRIAAELDMYNQYMATRCDSLNIPFINITDISRELGAASNALAPDQLHPSAYQYSLWVDRVYPVAKKILNG